jgi:hypothetical protein
MCCSVSGRGGLLIRVGADARERILREPHVCPMEMGGANDDWFRSSSPRRSPNRRGAQEVGETRPRLRDLALSKSIAREAAAP